MKTDLPKCGHVEADTTTEVDRELCRRLEAAVGVFTERMRRIGLLAVWTPVHQDIERVLARLRYRLHERERGTHGRA